eukprot:tig00000743_g3884.t1
MGATKRLVLSAMDTMLLGLETVGPPMNVLAVLELDTDLPHKTALFILNQLAASHLGFRSVLEQPIPAFGRATMRELESFSVADRLTQIQISAGSPEAAAEALHAHAAKLVARRLPRDRPLWEAHLVSFRGAEGEGEGKEGRAPPRAALIVLWSHALLDGMGGFGVLSSTLGLDGRADGGAAPDPAAPPAPAPPLPPPAPLFFTLSSAVLFAALLLVLVGPRLFASLAARLLDRWPPAPPHPAAAPLAHGPDSAGRVPAHSAVHPAPPEPRGAPPAGGLLSALAYPFAWIAAHVSYAWRCAGLLCEPRASPFFEGAPSAGRSVQLSRPVPLSAIKAAARDGRLGSGRAPPTVNDAVSGLVAAALAAEAPGKGDRAKRPLCQVPVDVRRLVAPPHGAGNALGFLRIRLPAAVGEPSGPELGHDPLLALRVGRVASQLRRAKRSLEPLVDWRIVRPPLAPRLRLGRRRRRRRPRADPPPRPAFLFPAAPRRAQMATLGVLPLWVLAAVYRFFLSERSMILTNCQGPSRPVFLAAPPGAKPAQVVGLWALSPQPCEGGSSACIVSLNGEVRVAWHGDASAGLRPARLAAAFDALAERHVRGGGSDLAKAD